MCTAVLWKAEQTYFGRNLDLDVSYDEKVVITPRYYEFKMRHVMSLKQHYAMIGMAVVVDGYPLYYEATNEKGLSMAGLNFPRNAFYHSYQNDCANVAPFEFIPWVLGQCSSVLEAKELLKTLNLVQTNFSDSLPLSPLHWMISDRSGSIVVESMENGLHVKENPWNVLTNNPPIDYHLMNMNQYMGLCEGHLENRLNPQVDLKNISLGFGALGLPGDYSSASRFVRACFVSSKLEVFQTENQNVNQFFHLLSSVSMPKGCVQCSNGAYEYTRYSCCCSESGKYFYTTYENSMKTCIDLHSVDLNQQNIDVFELVE